MYVPSCNWFETRFLMHVWRELLLRNVSYKCSGTECSLFWSSKCWTSCTNFLPSCCFKNQITIDKNIFSWKKHRCHSIKAFDPTLRQERVNMVNSFYMKLYKKPSHFMCIFQSFSGLSTKLLLLHTAIPLFCNQFAWRGLPSSYGYVIPKQLGSEAHNSFPLDTQSSIFPSQILL